MKNKFFTGFLSGLASSLVIIAIAVVIYALSTAGLDGNSGVLNSQGKERNKETVVKAETQDEEIQKIIKKINKLENIIDQYYMEEVDRGKLADGIYKGLVASLGDPYSTYYTKDEYTALMESFTGVYYGIGSTVSQNVSTGIITLVKPFVTGPAYEAGMLPGDILYMVEGEEVTGVDLTEVVSRMKGKEGTKVKLSVIREGVAEPIEFVITRRRIEVPTIEYEMLDGNIGYIAISEFDEVTAQQFRDAIKDLEKQGQVGLVIDLRDNGGGSLDTVVNMLDRMLPEGLIVYTEDKHGIREEKKSDNKESFKKPLAVLINGNSASASEIFAGAIQDYGIGTIVGTTSFGKGIVQSVIPMLEDGTAIKVTVSKYYTPNGRNIHGVGITPDVEEALKEELRKQVVIDKKEDNQLQKAVEVIKGKLK